MIELIIIIITLILLIKNKKTGLTTKGSLVRKPKQINKWQPGRVGPVGPEQGGGEKGQYNQTELCKSSNTYFIDHLCQLIPKSQCEKSKQNICKWVKDGITGKLKKKGIKTKAFAHSFDQSTKTWGKCWLLKDKKNNKQIVRAVDQNAGTWPNDGVYDYESHLSTPVGYDSNKSPYGKIKGKRGSEPGNYKQVMVKGLVDCNTGKFIGK